MRIVALIDQQAKLSSILQNSLIKESHTFSIVECRKPVETVTDILLETPEVVLNLTTTTESIPTVAMLKDFRIPYTGSDARVLLVTNNQNLTQQALLHEGLLVPKTIASDECKIILAGPSMKMVAVEGKSDLPNSVLNDLTNKVCKLFELRDYAKIGIILENGLPYVTKVQSSFCLELNESFQAYLATHNHTYGSFLTYILESVCKRNMEF